MPKSGKISSTRGAVQPGSGLAFSTTRKSIPLAALGLGAYRDASPAAASGAVQVGEGSCPLARPWLARAIPVWLPHPNHERLVAVGHKSFITNIARRVPWVAPISADMPTGRIHDTGKSGVKSPLIKLACRIYPKEPSRDVSTSTRRAEERNWSCAYC